MKKLIVGIGVLLWVAVLGFPSPTTYTLTPWPYGAIVWVQSPPENAQAMIDYATEAVQEVFSFWDLPVPAPAANWARPVQTSSQAWYRGMMGQIQSPSVPITGFIGRDYSLIRGTPVPKADSDELLILPAPSWDGEKTSPLIVGIYPDRESMDAACGDYSLGGAYGPPLSPRRLISHGATGPSASLAPILASESDIIISRTGDWRFAVVHELAHWLTDLVCMNEGIDLHSLPSVIVEGIADYTAHSLLGDARSWEKVAAAWAQAGGELTHVPPPLYHDVGTSVVSYLVKREGTRGFLESLPELAADWTDEAGRITPGWRAMIIGVRLSESDRALYEAKLERLDLCAWLLDPVIPPEARAVVDGLYTDRGNLSDIDAFWNIISTVPPRPSKDSWEELARREDTFRLVQSRDGADGEERAQVEVALRRYREAGDWQNYYTWFVNGLREVIAAWEKYN